MINTKCKGCLFEEECGLIEGPTPCEKAHSAYIWEVCDGKKEGDEEDFNEEDCYRKTL